MMDADEAKFLKDLEKILTKRGILYGGAPAIVEGTGCRLFWLYKGVVRRGGIEAVARSQNLWKELLAELHVPVQQAPLLRQYYMKYLYAYERAFFLGIKEQPTSFMKADGTPFSGTVTPVTRTAIPTVSQRFQSSGSESLILRHTLMFLQSEDKEEVNKALDMLTLKSYEINFVLKPSHLHLLTVLFNKLRSFMEVTADKDDDEGVGGPHDFHMKFVKQCSLILRNFTYMEENDKVLMGHPRFLPIIFRFLEFKSKEIQLNALQTLGNAMQLISLDSVDPEFLNVMLEFLDQDNLEMVQEVVIILAKLCMQEKNHAQLLKLDVTFFRRLEAFLFLGEEHHQLKDNVISLLINFVSFGSMRVKVSIAQNTVIIKHMILLLSDSRLDVKAATVLFHLSTEPKNHDIFIPYEQLLLELALEKGKPVAPHAFEILEQLNEPLVHDYY